MNFAKCTSPVAISSAVGRIRCGGSMKPYCSVSFATQPAPISKLRGPSMLCTAMPSAPAEEIREGGSRYQYPAVRQSMTT